MVDRAIRYNAMRLQWIGGNRVTKLKQIGEEGCEVTVDWQIAKFEPKEHKPRRSRY